MLRTLELFVPPSHTCLYLLDAVIAWIGMLFRHICLPEVVKGSFSEHESLNVVLTLLLGQMLDVARYGPHGSKLRLLCQGW
jgi:hypothetical protein